MSKFLNQLRITEIFYSLQGESTTSGLPTVFVRLTGCPLRCTYCDTAYAFHGGKTLRMEDIQQQIAEYDCKRVCVTGGEPLAQPGCVPFMTQLCELGYQVSIETSGALDIAAIDKRVMIVMDLKTPSSNEAHRNLMTNLEHLKPQDQIKFVVGSREDYDWSRETINTYKLHETCEVLFSTSFEVLSPQTLAEWILEDKLPVRFQLQLHKYLWDDAPGH